jgi:hypothetical protein
MVIWSSKSRRNNPSNASERTCVGAGSHFFLPPSTVIVPQTQTLQALQSSSVAKLACITPSGVLPCTPSLAS